MFGGRRRQAGPPDESKIGINSGTVEFVQVFGGRSAVRSAVADKVYDVFESEAKEFIPSVEPLHRVFAWYEETFVLNPTASAASFGNDVQAICDCVEDSLEKNDGSFRLFLLVIFVVNKVLDYIQFSPGSSSPGLKQVDRSSATSLQKRCKELFVRLKKLPVTYDRFLVTSDPRNPGKPSASLRCLEKALLGGTQVGRVRRRNIEDVLFVPLAEVMNRGHLDDRSGMGVAGWLTFARLAVQMCYLIGGKDHTWHRFFDTLRFKEKATWSTFWSEWQETLMWCDSVHRAIPFTMSALRLLLQKQYDLEKGAVLSVKDGLDLVQTYSQFFTEEGASRANEEFLHWYYNRCIDRWPGLSDKEFKQLIALVMVSVDVSVNTQGSSADQDRLDKLLTKLLSAPFNDRKDRGRPFHTCLRLLECVMVELKKQEAGTAGRNAPHRLKVVTVFKNVMATPKVSDLIEVNALISNMGLMSSHDEIKSCCASLVVDGLSSNKRWLENAAASEGGFGRTLATMVAQVYASGFQGAIQQYLASVLRLFSSWLVSHPNQAEGGRTMFDLLHWCPCLRQMDTNKAAARALEDVPLWHSPPVFNRHTFPLIWTLDLESPLLNHLSARMVESKKSGCLISQNSLAFRLWEKVLNDSKKKWMRAINGLDRNTKIQVVELLYAAMSDREVDPALEWLLYAAVLDPSTHMEPWDVPSMHVFLARCCALRSRLKTAYEWLQADDVFPWFARQYKALCDTHKLIVEKRYTAVQHAYYLSYQSQLGKIFQAIGLQGLSEADLPDHSPLTEKLKKLYKLMGWLREKRVEGFEQPVQDMQELLANSDSNLYCQLETCVNSAEVTLRPLEEPVQDDCPSNYGNHNRPRTTAMTVRRFLEHFVLKDSQLFDAVLDMHIPTQASEVVSPQRLSYCIGQVHNVFVQLLSLKLTVGMLQNVHRNLKFADMASEMRAICSCELYDTDHGIQQDHVVRTVKKSLETLQYITCIKPVVEALQMFEVVPIDDEDFCYLQSVPPESAEREDLTLDKVPAEYQRVNEIFQDLPPQNLEVFDRVRQCGNLISFFREMKFHESDQGKRRWAALRENITIRLQNNAFKSTLMNAVIVSYRCLAPFICTGVGLRQVVEHACKQCVSKEMAQQMQSASDNISQVRQLFQQAAASSTENALQLAGQLQKFGEARFYLRKLSCKKSTYDFKLQPDDDDDDESKDPAVHDEEEIAELRRQLLFCSSDDTAANAVASGFLSTMEAIDSLKQELFSLEADGHPDYQYHRQPITVALRSADSVRFVLKEKKAAAETWQTQLAKYRREHPLLLLFNNSEIADMLSLLTGGPLREVVINKMINNKQPLPASPLRSTHEEEKLAARCLSSIILSVTPIDDFQVSTITMGNTHAVFVW